MKPFDSKGAFQLDADGAGVRSLAIRGVGVTVFSGGMSFAIQMVATVVLSRLLVPADFGIVTMVTTFSLLFTSFGLNGFTEAVLQWDEIDHSLASNLFWVNLIAGILLTTGFAAGGALLAKFYHDPRVTRVAIGTSLTILVTSISVLHVALLKRAMRFSALSVNDIVARTVAVVVSIILGWAGWGYWALVAGLVALPLSVSVGAFILCPWVPSLPRRAPGTFAMMRFAMNIYSHCIVSYFAKNTDNLLVGRLFAAQSLGFYKKAYDLFVLPANQLLSPIAAVAISGLSRFNKESVQYRRYFLSGLSMLAFIGMVIGADLTLVGKDLIRLLLGPGWDVSGRIFMLFGPGIGIMLIYGTHGWIHLSIGRADRWFRWGIVEFVVTALLFVLALPWGLMGIAAAWTLSFWILTFPAFWYAGKPIGFGIAPVLTSIWRYALASLVAGCISAITLRAFPSLAAAPGAMGALWRIVITSLLVSATYLGAVVALHRGFAPIRQLARLLPQMVPWGRTAEPSPLVHTHDATESAAISLIEEENPVGSGV